MSRILILTAPCFCLVVMPAFAQPGRQEIRLGAAELATASQRADEPTPGKWWFQRDKAGDLLLSGKVATTKPAGGEWQVTPVERFVPYQVPTLVVDPKAKGWYRIYVGLVHDPLEPNGKLLARLSKEPYPEYLQTPEHTKTKTAEVYWKPADLTGQKIHLEPPPAPMQHPGHVGFAGITHLRLVPMSPQEVDDAKREIELPPKKDRLFGMLDYTDEVFWWGTVEKEDDIRAIVYRHRQAGFGRIYWRAYGSCSDHTLHVPEAAPRWTDADEKRWCTAQKCKVGWLPYINLPKKFDPLKVAVEYGAKNDIEVHAWVRFTNHNREPYANFWWENRAKFAAQMVATKKDPKTGKIEPIKPYQYSAYPRVLSLAYPEVRAYYVKFFKAMADTGVRGILIDLLRHPPIAGYEPIVSTAFKKKYGMDMETRDLYHDPLVQEHLSQYLRQFLVDLRKAIGKDLEISVRSSGPDKYALRGKEWIEEGLIDSLIDGQWYSGNGPRPTIAATVAAASKRGHAYAIIEPWDVDPKKGWTKRPGTLSPEALAALAAHYRGKGLSGIGLYESTVFTYVPDLRRAVRAAGWSFSER
jgi:hypothetical protein